MGEKAEKFHQSNGGLDSALLIDPDNRVGCGHDNFPNDLLDDLIGCEKSILRHFRGVALLFQLYEVTSTHPEVVNVPALEDVPEILSEKQSNKDSVCPHDINPAAVVSVGHKLKGLPQGSALLNLDVFDRNILEQG